MKKILILCFWLALSGVGYGAGTCTEVGSRKIDSDASGNIDKWALKYSCDAGAGVSTFDDTTIAGLEGWRLLGVVAYPSTAGTAPTDNSKIAVNNVVTDGPAMNVLNDEGDDLIDATTQKDCVPETFSGVKRYWPIKSSLVVAISENVVNDADFYFELILGK